MSIPLFTDAMGYDKKLTNFDVIKQMSVEELAQFMFDCGADCCDYCEYKESCDGCSCEYNTMTTDIEIIEDWLVDEYE